MKKFQMRLPLLLLIALGFSFSACKKYNLKQPSHLSFTWKMVNPSVPLGSVQEVYFYGSSVEISGTRKEGADISLSQIIPSEMVSVSPGSLFSVKIDIPMGEYTSLNAKINFAEHEGTNFGIVGGAEILGTPVMFRVVWPDFEGITFKANEELQFKKKKNYNLSLCCDVSKLLDGITQEDWNTASVSQEEGGPVVLIQDIKNHALFVKIQSNLANAVYISMAE